MTPNSPSPAAAATPPYEVCLLGVRFDIGNRGVHALGKSLIQLVLEARPDARISLLYSSFEPGEQKLTISQRELSFRIVDRHRNELEILAREQFV